MEVIPKRCSRSKIFMLFVIGVINLILFGLSLMYNYQEEVLKQHTKFGNILPTKYMWRDPPYGYLKCFIFNVTNHKEFLNGTDKKIKFQQIGPIVYKMFSKEADMKIENSTLTYRKIRYNRIVLDEEFTSPEILQQSVIVPNIVILSSASFMNSWMSLVKQAFSVVTFEDSMFVKRTIHELFWNNTTPVLNRITKFLPYLPHNTGILFNAVDEKDAIFKVNISSENGFKDFFRIISYNGEQIIPEFKQIKPDPHSCTINATNAFDSTLFPPFMTKETEISVLLSDTCRVKRMRYVREVKDKGFNCYQYEFEQDPRENCFNNAMGIPLPYGFSDISKCSRGGTPMSYSPPNFYNTDYNWQEHFEGLNPNEEEHKSKIIIEPTTGTPTKVIYRFQASIPMPKLDSYSEDIMKFSNMKIPTFWYEFNMDHMSLALKINLVMIVNVLPALQIIFLALFSCMAVFCFWLTYSRYRERMEYNDLIHNSDKKLLK